MKTQSINETLLNNLFINLNPKDRKSEFKSLLNYIFPGISDFQYFLREANYEKKVLYAKKILLRMSFEMNFPPPSKLLFNILDMETEISPITKNGFISKDHFVHLVNLYLLGIYFFIYHNSLQHKVINIFRKQRYQQLHERPTNLNLILIKNMVDSWRLFVMYHDLGYPIEYYFGKNGSFAYSEELNNYKKSRNIQGSIFKDTSRFINKDISLKALTELIVCYQIAFSEKNTILKEYIDSFYQDEDSFTIINANDDAQNVRKKVHIKDLTKNFSEYKEIEKIFGNTSLRMMISVLKWENYIAILKSKKTDEPCYILVNDNDNCFIYSTPNNKHYKYAVSSILNDAKNNKVDNDGFYWSYFLNEKSIKINDYFEKTFPEINYSSFIDAIKYFSNKVPLKLAHVTNEQEFKDYCFNIYSLLYTTVGMMDNEPDTTSKYEVLYHTQKPILQGLSKDLPSEVSNIFLKLFYKEFKEIKFEDISEDINTVINEIILAISTIKDEKGKANSNIKNFINVITENVHEEIKSRFQTQLTLISIWKCIREKVSKLSIESKIGVSIDNEKYKDTFNFEKLFSERVIIPEIHELLKKIGIPDIKVFFLNYFPDFAKEEKRVVFYDHGVASAMIFADVLNMYSNFINLIKTGKAIEEDKLLIDLGLGMAKDEILVSNLELKKQFLIVFHSILLHNIYPEYLPKKFNNFRTSIEKDPFTFFSIFCDSLQPWDRKRNFNPAFMDLPYSVFGDKFDIQITKDGRQFLIFEKGLGLDIKKRNEELGLYLDKYLEHGSILIFKNLQDFNDTL